VFDNKDNPGEDPTESTVVGSDEDESGAAFLIRILRYLETPQYLRKTLFPKHNSLRFVVRVVLRLAVFLYRSLHVLRLLFDGKLGWSKRSSLLT